MPGEVPLSAYEDATIVQITQPLVRRLQQVPYDQTLEGKLRHIAAFFESLSDPHTTPEQGTGLICAANIRTAGLQCGIYQTLSCNHQMRCELWVSWIEIEALPLGVTLERLRGMLTALAVAANEHVAGHCTVTEVEDD